MVDTSWNASDKAVTRNGQITPPLANEAESAMTNKRVIQCARRFKAILSIIKPVNLHLKPQLRSIL